MKTLLALCLTMIVSGAIAATPYDSLINLCNEVAWNGGCEVEKYDVKKFNYTQAVRMYLKDITEKEQPILRRNDIVYAIDMLFVGVEDIDAEQNEFVNRMTSLLLRSKKVKAVMAIGPHGENCTESEYCSFLDILIYTTDGYMLNMYLAYTT